jgi:hypothetical protein
MMKVVYMDSDDLYQLLIKYRVYGFCEEVGRLALGVNMGDAGVMGELLQARYDPSAGQRALQDASPVLLASHVPVNAAAGEDAEDADAGDAGDVEQAEQAEPQPLEQQAENRMQNCIAPNAEPQARAPPNAEQEQLFIRDAEPRGPAEMPLQLRNLEVEIEVEERRTNFKRKQYDLDLEQGAWRKCPEWRGAHEWNLKYSAGQLELEDKKWALEQKKQNARLEFKTKEFELRKKQEEWEMERKYKMAAVDKKIKEYEAA